jgi:hypothetical protein
MSTVETPPVAPGSLTAAPSADALLSYLDALNRWVAKLRATLDALDASAEASDDPGKHTADIVLAMSLWNSIDARRAQLVKTWDSGRVLREELATLATMIWGRLSDPFGAPTAFTLPEACVLVSALADKLSDELTTTAIGGSGAAARIEPLRAAIERCRIHAHALAHPTTRIDELAAKLEAALEGTDARAIAATVEAVDIEITAIERNFIKEASRRAGATAQVAELERRYQDLVRLEREVRELAERCTEKIANAPRLGVPTLRDLGPPPSARDQVGPYAQRLGRIGAALHVAQQRFAAPLSERDDLRGLLGAYRHRASAKGLAEDSALHALYQPAYDALWSAPCDLVLARGLVGKYQHAVRVAVGADIEPEPGPARTARADADATPAKEPS